MKNCLLPITMLFFGLAEFSVAEDSWLEKRFGRPHPDQLFWSADPKKAEAFKPSGIGLRIFRCGEFTLLHNHGIYHSSEENPDVSHDQRASVIVFKGDQRVFVARGYKFSDFKCEVKKSSIEFKYWTGVMGDDQIKKVKLTLAEDGIQCTTRAASTKE